MQQTKWSFLLYAAFVLGLSASLNCVFDRVRQRCQSGYGGLHHLIRKHHSCWPDDSTRSNLIGYNWHIADLLGRWCAGREFKIRDIDNNGVYTAPAIVPDPNNVVTITSLATKFPQDTPGSVTVTVLNPIPVINSVTPSSFSEGTTTITI